MGRMPAAPLADQRLSFRGALVGRHTVIERQGLSPSSVGARAPEDLAEAGIRASTFWRAPICSVAEVT